MVTKPSSDANGSLSVPLLSKNLHRDEGIEIKFVSIEAVIYTLKHHQNKSPKIKALNEINKLKQTS